ncbi:MAG: NDP-sugar synthase [Candidatus Aenigmatarchaeota archaeon]
MKAYVLAAGEATRLRPISYGTPKLMVQVGARPIIEWILDTLSKSGQIDEVYVIIRAGDVHEGALKNYLKHRGEYFANDINVSVEYGLGWETGGDLSLVLRSQDNRGILDKTEDFLVLYGDVISDIDIKKLIETHEEGRNKLRTWVTISLFEVPVDEAYKFGVAEGKKESETLYRITSFIEKPPKEKIPKSDKVMVNAGYSVIGKEIYHNLDRFLPAKKSRLEHTLFEVLAETKELAGYLYPCNFWMDIGDIYSLEEANKRIYSGKGIIPPALKV